MYNHEALYRQARVRMNECERQAAKERALLPLRSSLRATLARTLMRLAERLEPAPQAEGALSASTDARAKRSV